MPFDFRPPPAGNPKERGRFTGAQGDRCPDLNSAEPLNRNRGGAPPPGSTRSATRYRPFKCWIRELCRGIRVYGFVLHEPVQFPPGKVYPIFKSVATRRPKPGGSLKHTSAAIALSSERKGVFESFSLAAASGRTYGPLAIKEGHMTLNLLFLLKSGGQDSAPLTRRGPLFRYGESMAKS